MGRITAALAGLALLALAATGCAPGGTEAEEGKLSVIADSTTQVGTARMTMTMTMTLPEPMGEVVVVTDGVLDTVAEAYEATVSLDGAPGMGEQTGELIVVDGVQYQRGDMASAMQPDLGERWLRTAAPEQSGGVLPGSTGASPLDLLGQLRGAAGTVTEEGTDTIRDVEVTRYRLVSTLGDLMAAQGEGLPPEMDQQLAAQPELAEADVVIDVWADDQDLARRMQIEMDLTAAFQGMPGLGGGDVTSLIEIELYDFGIEVAISAPAEDEVLDLQAGAVAMDQEGLGGSSTTEASGGDQVPVPGPTTYIAGPALPGAREPLSLLPYPMGAERVEVSSTRIVYTVPAAGDDPVADLESFFVARLPAFGWVQSGAAGSASGGSDGAVQDGTGLILEGHGTQVEVIIELDEGNLVVLLATP
jgi:hypothetical protein